MRTAMLGCVLTISLLLTGCGRTEKGNSPMDLALAIRQDYLAADGCDAVLEVTADHGQRVHTFGVEVTVCGKETNLTVIEPEEVAGIRARLDGDQAGLGFDDVILDTGLLDDSGLTVLGALPTLLEAARSGWIDSCVREELDGADTLHVICRDPAVERGTGREQHLWFDTDSHALLRGEVLVDGRRVIFCCVTQFTLYGG